MHFQLSKLAQISPNLQSAITYGPGLQNALDVQQKWPKKWLLKRNIKNAKLFNLGDP